MSRWAATGPSLFHPLNSTTIVRWESATGLSLRSKSEANRLSWVDTMSCRRSRMRLRRSIKPRRFRSSRLCSGSSRIATRKGQRRYAEIQGKEHRDREYVHL